MSQNLCVIIQGLKSSHIYVYKYAYLLAFKYILIINKIFNKEKKTVNYTVTHDNESSGQRLVKMRVY